MCRLYGFRCSAHEPVHAQLVAERNSLRRQSIEHPDGWGIAAYIKGSLPEVAHGLGPAHIDPEFERVSGLLQARAVMAHVRPRSLAWPDPAAAAWVQRTVSIDIDQLVRIEQHMAEIDPGLKAGIADGSSCRDGDQVAMMGG